LAVLSALSAKAQDGDIIVIDNLAVAEYKTKAVVNMLAAVGVTKKALIVTPSVDVKIVKSASNIPGVKTTTADNINTYDVLNGGKFIISVDAAKKLEEVFAV
ncbi:MAG: uL4 family ribosomal protein, partial [Oscillospiraceae bacterium]